jgi:hypothetical protein
MSPPAKVVILVGRRDELAPERQKLIVQLIEQSGEMPRAEFDRVIRSLGYAPTATRLGGAR